MLVLSIREGEAVRLSGFYILVDGAMVPAGDVRVVVADLRRQYVRLAVDAPRAIPIDRLDTDGCRKNTLPEHQPIERRVTR